MKIYILDVSGGPGTPLQFIFVTSLSNKRYSYHLWMLVIAKSGKKKKNNKFNRLEIELFSLPNISPAYKIPLPSNIGPSNLSFVHIYAQFSFKKGISLRALDVAILWGHLMFLSGQEQAIFSSWGI